jgi:hypothetical protein
MPELIHPADDLQVDVVEPPPTEPTDAPPPDPQTTPQAPTQEDTMDTTPSTGFFPITWSRYRKAVGAAVGSFLSTYPVVGVVTGEVADWRNLLGAAIVAAVAAAWTAMTKPNEA